MFTSFSFASEQTNVKYCSVHFYFSAWVLIVQVLSMAALIYCEYPAVSIYISHATGRVSSGKFSLGGEAMGEQSEPGNFLLKPHPL